jgi:hypothetical protein
VQEAQQQGAPSSSLPVYIPKCRLSLLNRRRCPPPTLSAAVGPPHAHRVAHGGAESAIPTSCHGVVVRLRIQIEDCEKVYMPHDNMCVCLICVNRCRPLSSIACFCWLFLLKRLSLTAWLVLSVVLVFVLVSRVQSIGTALCFMTSVILKSTCKLISPNLVLC